MTQTHRSFVNRWECDENSHMNVQFYIKRFDEAAQILASLEKRATKPELLVRHVRYHRELHEGDSTIINSHWINNSYGTSCVHLLSDAVTGELCTTAIDQVSAAGMIFSSDIPQEELSAAQPRGLSAGEIATMESARLLKNGRALVSNYSMIETQDLDSDGRLYCNRIISRFTDGASHVWDHGGITTPWLQENNFGRVAVEMKVMPTAVVSQGTALQLISAITEVNGRTFHIQHDLQEINSGKTVARGEVCCLVMDLEQRRAVSLPTNFKLAQTASCMD